MSRTRVAIVGAGKRTDYLYAPLVKTLKDEFELAGIFGRRPDSATALGIKHGVPAFVDMDRLIAEAKPDLLVLAVHNPENGPVGRRIAEYGLPMLVETPIANSLEDADAIIATSRRTGAPIEVAEQYYRRPMERIKRALIQAGIVGQVNVAYNDEMGHAYHGISLVRSYIGFDVPVTSASMVRRQYAVKPHHNWLRGAPNEQETWEHGVMQFANGAIGVFDWTTIGYGSSLRWQRSTRFFASAGMVVGDEVTVLSEDGHDRVPIRLERRIHNVGGMEALSEVVAHTQPQIVWRNPFAAYYMDDEMIAVGDCLLGLATAARTGGQPEYGPTQGRTDQAVYLAMRASAEQGGAPVPVG